MAGQDVADGTPFGRYRLVELLGGGGMGEVWRAYDTVSNNRTVAIKLLWPHLAADQKFVQRFRREADAAAGLNNPHIVPIHNYGEIDGRLYVDMRLIAGRDLGGMLANGPMDPEQAVRIIEQVAKALHAAHKIGLVHRDVKPSNVLLDEDDFAYLIDFGIAQAAHQTRMTETNAVIGSWHYMPPERFRAGQVDARSDIYALACVLYECLTGNTPYSGDDFEQQITAHLYEPPPCPSETDPNIPVALDRVIAIGMAKDRTQRYATSIELAFAARDAITVANRQSAPTRVRPLTERAPSPIPTPAYVYDAPSQPVLNPPAQSAAQRARETLTPNAAASASPPADEREVWPTPGAPDQPPASGRARRLSRRTAIALISGAIAIVAAITAAAVIPALLRHKSSKPYGLQIVLQFNTTRADGIATDSSGNVYATDTLHNRIMALPVGRKTACALKFDHGFLLSAPTGVATDDDGNVYVNDAGNKRVIRFKRPDLAAGDLSVGQMTPLNFPPLGHPTGLAVGKDHTVYVADTSSNVVYKLPPNPGAEAISVPFTGLVAPTGLTIAEDETLYVADGGNNRVLRLPKDSDHQERVDFHGLRDPGGVAVDSQGAVYVTDSEDNRVLTLPSGTMDASAQDVLPFTGLDYPWGVAVGHDGTVYVADKNQVVKLQVG